MNRKKRSKRIHKFPINYILQQLTKAVKAGKKVIKIKGYDIDIDERILTYVHDGVMCRGCGLEATHWGLDKDPYWHGHLNLYGMRDGSEVLMTSDHIIPKSKGGPDDIENRQCMCCKCNQKKGDKYEL